MESGHNRLTQTRLCKTQTLYFRVMFVSGSRVVLKIANEHILRERTEERKSKSKKPKQNTKRKILETWWVMGDRPKRRC
jgi:hypothetical protein